jgi:hypothetical protein
MLSKPSVRAYQPFPASTPPDPCLFSRRERGKNVLESEVELSSPTEIASVVSCQVLYPLLIYQAPNIRRTFYSQVCTTACLCIRFSKQCIRELSDLSFNSVHTLTDFRASINANALCLNIRYDLMFLLLYARTRS